MVGTGVIQNFKIQSKDEVYCTKENDSEQTLVPGVILLKNEVLTYLTCKTL